MTVLGMTPRVLAATIAALLALPAAASGQLPNLVSDPVSSPSLQVNTSTIEGTQVTRLLLRFNSYIHNIGPGPVEVRATVDDVDDEDGMVALSVQQIVAGGSPVTMPASSLLFENRAESNADGHYHWHFQNAAEYSLLDPAAALPAAPAEKVGFCMVDSENIEQIIGGSYWFDCVDQPTAGAPNDGVVKMGISPGWRDLYTKNLAHQYVDVSNAPPGPYTLRAVTDPLDRIDEVDEANGAGDIAVTLPGYAPKPRIASRPAGTAPITFGLGATAYGSDLDPVEFRLVDPPDHGTVTLGTGWTTDPVVTYTPDAGGGADDTFTYAVREAGSPFPKVPPAVQFAIDVGDGAPVIAIGNLGQVVTGTTVQLSSQPAADFWRVSAGSITPSGAYTAPKSVPAGGLVDVTAVSPAGAVARGTLRIVEPSPSTPEPLPPGAPAGEPLPTGQAAQPVGTPTNPTAPIAPPTPIVLPRPALGKVTAARVGRNVAVTAVAGQAGRLTITLRKGRRTIKGCIIDVRAGASHTCRIRRPRGERSALKVVVVMRRRAGGSVTKTVAIKALSKRARAAGHPHIH